MSGLFTSPTIANRLIHGQAMTRRITIAALVLCGMAGTAGAQNCCPTGSRITGAPLLTLVANKTACAQLGADKWQEFHKGATAAGGDLIDWKQGPGNPVDPTEKAGTWSVIGLDQSRVQYDYGGGGVYQYRVCQPSPPAVNFCGDGSAPNVLNATLKDGQVAC